MKIAYFEAHWADEAKLRERLPEAELVVMPEALGKDPLPILAAGAEVISVMVWSKVDADILAQFPELKMIATRSTGYDHIDVAACRERGIVVSNVPTYGEHTVAEHTFALLLSLSRKIFQSYERTERHNFNREGLQGFDLFEKTLGVVGTGNIGKHVVEMAEGFGMKVIAYDVKQEADVKYVDSLEELLRQSDVITLHVPYLQATHHLINKENIKLAKPGAILINTARGGIVETEALLWALDRKILSGAGLDVLEEEGDMFDDLAVWSREIPENKDIKTLWRNHVLIARDDVIITPHNAFNSKEAVQSIFDTTVENIKAFLAGTLKNTV